MNYEKPSINQNYPEYSYKLTPFKLFTLQNFPYIESDFDAITNYQLFCKVVEYLNEVIANENTVESIVQQQIDNINVLYNWFNELDYVSVIDDKLDELVRDGTLGELINAGLEEISVNLDARLDNVEYKVDRLTSMNPIPVSSVSDMTNTNRVYLNTTDGKWYYYNGTAWVEGGIYQSPVSDDLVSNVVDASYNAYTVESTLPQTMTIDLGASINETTGARVTNTPNRALSLRNSSANNKVVTLISDTYTIKPYFFSGNSGSWGPTYIGTTNDWGSKFWIGTGPYYALCFKRNDDAVLTSDDISAIREILHMYHLTDSSLSITNSPADAKVTGDSINTLTDNITARDNFYNPIDNVSYVQNTLTIFNNSTIKTSNGTTEASTNRARTGRTINVRNRGSRIKMTGDTYQVSVRYYYDGSEVYPDSYAGYEDWGNDYWIGKYPYIGLVFRRVDNQPLSESDITNIKNSLHFYKYTDNTLSIANVPADAKAVGDMLNETASIRASVSMYASFGVLGASWDNGYIYTDENTPHRITNLSWGANLARMNGNTFKCYARDGVTTRSALTNQYCLPKLLSSTANDLYILTLGGNDARNLGIEYLGTINDINDEDYTQNADTFYGNYGRIISQIMEHAPNSKIIMAMFYDSNRHNEVRGQFFNATIEIANHFNIPVAYWEHDPFYTSPLLYENYIGGHPTAVQLSGLAKSFERIYSECVYNNYDYFKVYINDNF